MQNPITPHHHQRWTQPNAVAIYMSSKKDGLVRRVEADMKIHHIYPTNRKPIACLLHGIMTDVGENVVLHSNQINAFLLSLSLLHLQCTLQCSLSLEQLRQLPWVARHLRLLIVYMPACTLVCLLICAFNMNVLNIRIRLL